MKNYSRKLRVVVMCVALAVIMTVGGTFAYLYSTSDPVVNRFDDNDVEVTISETDNTYSILPGTSDPKDPTVTVTTSVPAYAYVQVTDNTQGLVTWEPAEGWTQLEGYDDVWYREVAADDDAQEFHFLKDDKVYYSSGLTREQIKNGVAAAETADPTNGVNLTFTPYAIQKVPFNDPAKAWVGIGAQVVATEAELAAALSSGGAVILGDDIDLTSSIAIDSAAVIDLDGHSITHSANCAIVVGQGGDLLVTGTGSIAADTFVENGGTLTDSHTEG